MKVIFLDIDGVLNEETTPTRTKSCVIFIDQEKLMRLKKIVCVRRPCSAGIPQTMVH